MFDFLKRYFGTGSLLLKESMVLMFSFAAYISFPNRFAFIASTLALFFILLIVLKAKRALADLELMKTGRATQAVLVKIENTWQKTNTRRVKKYTFHYETEGATRKVVIKSSRIKDFSIGQSFIAYYAHETPSKAFVPGFFGINV